MEIGHSGTMVALNKEGLGLVMQNGFYYIVLRKSEQPNVLYRYSALGCLDFLSRECIPKPPSLYCRITVSWTRVHDKSIFTFHC